MRCEALRPFQATNDYSVDTGEIVETDGWREESVLRLIAQRYLRQVPDVEPAPHATPSQDTPATAMDTLGRFPRQQRKRA